MHGYKTNNDNSRNDDSNIPVCFSDNLGSFNMKAGDLISFKPIDFGLEDWSNPCIVMGGYESPNEGLWNVWCDGIFCVIDDTNYEIMYLTSSLLDKTTSE